MIWNSRIGLKFVLKKEISMDGGSWPLMTLLTSLKQSALCIEENKND